MGSNPQNKFWGVHRRFQAKLANAKNVHIIQKCIDSNQILHNDKEHQMPFVGGPNTRIKNSR